MEELLKLIGSELYGKVIEKLAGAKIIIDDGKLIPKHRFDCVNLSLKDHKEQNLKQKAELETLKEQVQMLRNTELYVGKLEREVLILSELSNYKAKNYKTILPLLNLNGISMQELKSSLCKQICNLKKSDPYLFADCNELYKLVPYKQNKKSE